MSFKKNLLFLIISFLIGLGVFLYVGDTIGWNAIWRSFNIFTKWNGVLIVLISFLIALISTIRWKVILRDEGVNDLSIKKMFKIYLGGFSIMYLFPIIILGGEAFRAYTLSDKCKIPLDKSISSIIIERILEWTLNVIVIAIGVLYFFYAIATPSFEILISFGFAFLIVLILLVFVYSYVLRKKDFISRIVKKFNKELHEENIALKIEKDIFEYFNSFKIWKGFFYSFLRVLLMFLRVWLILIFLGDFIAIMPSLSILGFSYVSTIIPIPATLGMQEVIQTFAFESLGFEGAQATAFTMILRAGDLIVSILGLVVFFGLGLKFLKNKL